MRKLIGVDPAIIDDFALQAQDAADTADIYELVVERHHAAATVLNLEPGPERRLPSCRSDAGPVRRRPIEKRRLGARDRR